jgi:hypothetical protein
VACGQKGDPQREAMEAEDAVEMNQQVAYVLLGVLLALCTLSIERFVAQSSPLLLSFHDRHRHVVHK